MSDHADRAMLKVLRSGHVHCRGNGIDECGNPIEINHLLPKLQGILFDGETVVVRYDERRTRLSVPFRPAPMLPLMEHHYTVETSARFKDLKLALDEFRDGLRFELPAEAMASDLQQRG